MTDMPRRERRYRRIHINKDVFLRILNGQVTIRSFDVPDDAQVDAVYQDMVANTWCLIIESAQFDHVPLGMEVPSLPPLAVQRRDDR